MSRSDKARSDTPASGLLRRVWAASFLVLACLAAAGLYYALHVQAKADYLTGRDFRYLGALGRQLHEVLDSQGRSFSNLAKKKVVVAPATAVDTKDETKLTEATKAKIDEDKEQRENMLRELARRVEGVQTVELKLTKEAVEGWGSVPGAGMLFHRIDPAVDPPRLELFHVASEEEFRRVLKKQEEERTERAGQGADELRRLEHPFILRGSIRLSHLLPELLVPGGAFETVLLADARGRVVFHSPGGPSLSDLRPFIEEARARQRPRRGRDEPGRPSPAGGDLVPASEAFEIELRGRAYRLFVEPVRLPLRDVPPGRALPDYRQAGTSAPWLVCGLVSKRDFAYQSMAVSSALVAGLAGALFLAFLSWPFLKLRLIGERQRVTVVDVVLLGFASVAGAAVLTLVLLDVFAFVALERQAEAQVADLAGRLGEDARAELAAAYSQLLALEERAAGEVGELQAEREKANALAAGDFAWTHYPFWINFAVLDSRGKQIRKWLPGETEYPRISVADRAYFTRARDEEVWTLGDVSGGGTPLGSLVVEPVVGWAATVRMAILAKPTPRALRDEGYPVSMLSIPMLSLIDAVLAPGFKYAVIEADGDVLFHSDQQRDGLENLFVETDDDRRLRAVVVARRSEPMTLRYWGEDYLAQVAPIEGTPWTVVALADKRTLRSVNLDWLAGTLALLAWPLATLAAGLALVLAIRPGYRAGWLWPVETRTVLYRELALSLGLLALGAAAAILLARGDDRLIVFSWFLPPLAVAVAFLKLAGSIDVRRRRPARAAVVLLAAIALGALASGGWSDLWALALAGPLVVAAVAVAWVPSGRSLRGWPWLAPPTESGVAPVCLAYATAGLLLLVATGVAPTAGLFTVAHRIHTESHVKHGQLVLAERLAQGEASAIQKRAMERIGRDGALDADMASSIERLAGLGVYASSFYGTSGMEPPSASAHAVCSSGRGAEQAGLRLAELLLPQATHRSAETQELLHQGASDGAWGWEVAGGRLVHHRCVPGEAFRLSSELPPPTWAAVLPAAGTSRGEGPALAGFVSPGLGLVARLSLLALFAAVLWAVVLFVARQVFFADLRVPVWSGRNLFLVTRRQGWNGDHEAFVCLDLARAGEEGWWPAELDRLRASGRDVLVRNLGQGMGDPALAERKLACLEEVAALEQTVVVVTRVAPTSLTGPEGEPPRNDLEARWRALLAGFTVVERARPSLDEIRMWVWLVESEGFPKPDGSIRSPVLAQEAGSDEVLQRIARALDKIPVELTAEQLLEELAERAERHYRLLWSRCSRDEQAVLEHLAEDGLVNPRSGRTLRRLLSRGLVRRDPRLRVMNETFRRFVVSSACRTEVRKIEREADASAWDKFRSPFFAVLAGSLAFLAVTQREAWDSATTTVTGLVATLPALAKFLEIVTTGRGGSRGGLGGE